MDIFFLSLNVFKFFSQSRVFISQTLNVFLVSLILIFILVPDLHGVIELGFEILELFLEGFNVVIFKQVFILYLALVLQPFNLGV